MEIRNDWTKEEISKIFHQPVMELIYQGASAHRAFNDPTEVQVCTLLYKVVNSCTRLYISTWVYMIVHGYFKVVHGHPMLHTVIQGCTWLYEVVYD